MTKGSTATSAAAQMSVGQYGMTMLKYTGPDQDLTLYKGAVTKTRYYFGGGRVVGYVDSRDVPALLETSLFIEHQFTSAPADDAGKVRIK